MFNIRWQRKRNPVWGRGAVHIYTQVLKGQKCVLSVCCMLIQSDLYIQMRK